MFRSPNFAMSLMILLVLICSTNIRNRFWHGEMMFVTTYQSVGGWKTSGKEFLKEANGKIIKFAEKLTPEQFGVVQYISTLFGKWIPYDDQTWIVEY